MKQDPKYRKELIIEATNTFLDSDISTGKTLLRDYLNATEALLYIASELAQDEKEHSAHDWPPWQSDPEQ